MSLLLLDESWKALNLSTIFQEHLVVVLKLCAVRVSQVCRENFLKLKLSLIFHKIFYSFPI